MTGVIDNTDAASAEPVDAAFAARLMDAEPTSLSAAELLDRAADLERIASVVLALQQETLVELARRPFVAAPAEDPAEFSAPGEVAREGVCDELALALGSSARAVDHRLTFALALVRLPVARDLLRTGRLDAARARVLVNETGVLDDESAALVDAQVSPLAPALTPARLRRRARVAVLRVDRKAAQTRNEKARELRLVQVIPRPDGMAELTAVLPALDAVRAFDVLTAAARRVRRDAADEGRVEERSLDQLRADLVGDVFRFAASTGKLPCGAPVGAGVEIQVHAHVGSLLGLDDEPAFLAGYGPITAAAVRELEPDARMRRLLVEPVSGAVLDVGRTSYQPTVAIARHVRATHPRCTFPTCEQPARRSELDHVLPYPLGPTSVDNLRPRCRSHHRLKHHPLIEIEERADGTTRWTLPTGCHDNEPEPPLPPPDDPPF